MLYTGPYISMYILVQIVRSEADYAVKRLTAIPCRRKLCQACSLPVVTVTVAAAAAAAAVVAWPVWIFSPSRLDCILIGIVAWMQAMAGPRGEPLSGPRGVNPFSIDSAGYYAG